MLRGRALRPHVLNLISMYKIDRRLIEGGGVQKSYTRKLPRGFVKHYLEKFIQYKTTRSFLVHLNSYFSSKSIWQAVRDEPEERSVGLCWSTVGLSTKSTRQPLLSPFPLIQYSGKTTKQKLLYQEGTFP